MNPSTNTKKNYLYNVICELVTTLIPLITTPYVTRILGRGGMGSYQYVLTIASYFVLFANFGVKAYGNRCIAQAKDNPDERSRVFSGIFSQQLMLSAVVSVLYLGYALAFGGEYRVIFAVFGINMLSAMLEITWLYWGMESFRPVAFSTIAVKVAVAVGIFLLVREEDDLWIYALLCSLGVIAVQLYLWCGVHRFVRFVRVPFAEIRRHFLPCLALLIPMISPTLFRSMDKLMLESMSGAEAVGLYGAAEQLQTCMLGFITGLGTVMLPRVSHLLAQGREEDAHAYIGDSMQFEAFIGSIFTFGIAAASSVFVPYYYGEAFSEAAILTTVLSPTILMIAVADVVRAQYVIPHKRDRIFIVSVIVGAACNLACNAVCIPWFSSVHETLGMTADAAAALGSLPGTLLAELSVIAVQYLYLRRELPYKTYFRTCAIFPIAGLLMFIAARGVKVLCMEVLSVTSPLLVLAAEVAVGAVVYLGITGGWYYRFRRETLNKLIRK
ncbi:MAG: oligosaccharide flippase family protein [Clostridia bacterium]|nr:oligosaccharide flippase family protein [Clostridia bacterium]